MNFAKSKGIIVVMARQSDGNFVMKEGSVLMGKNVGISKSAVGENNAHVDTPVIAVIRMQIATVSLQV